MANSHRQADLLRKFKKLFFDKETLDSEIEQIFNKIRIETQIKALLFFYENKKIRSKLGKQLGKKYLENSKRMKLNQKTLKYSFRKK